MSAQQQAGKSPRPASPVPGAAIYGTFDPLLEFVAPCTLCLPIVFARSTNTSSYLGSPRKSVHFAPATGCALSVIY